MTVDTKTEHDAGPDDLRAENKIVFDTQATGFEHGLEQTVLSGPGLQLLHPVEPGRLPKQAVRLDGTGERGLSGQRPLASR